MSSNQDVKRRPGSSGGGGASQASFDTFVNTTAPATYSPRYFKVARRDGVGDYTSVSTSFAAIDSTNFGFTQFGGFDLAVGDVVKCEMGIGTFFSSLASDGGVFDWEVDQPTSANTSIAVNDEYGLVNSASITAISLAVNGYFTATEAGVHAFRPIWRRSGGAVTITIGNSSSGFKDACLWALVKKMGQPG